MTFRRCLKYCIKKPLGVHRLCILCKRSVSIHVIIQDHCNVTIAALFFCFFFKRTINPTYASFMTFISACAFEPSFFTSLRDPPHSSLSPLGKEWIRDLSIIFSCISYVVSPQ